MQVQRLVPPAKAVLSSTTDALIYTAATRWNPLLIFGPATFVTVVYVATRLAIDRWAHAYSEALSHVFLAAYVVALCICAWALLRKPRRIEIYGNRCQVVTWMGTSFGLQYCELRTLQILPELAIGQSLGRNATTDTTDIMLLNAINTWNRYVSVIGNHLGTSISVTPADFAEFRLQLENAVIAFRERDAHSRQSAYSSRFGIPSQHRL
eukprot:TRINITY_DN1755_c0_g1_i1.p1 TRINITY_DN1755_c0_g1~~TRINITY_DN1755_c0_g1_i1.p1  ORF type:complete len:209 (+),score=22.05 TRINITY_DN1755_c0_g1_i1:118-744(+)